MKSRRNVRGLSDREILASGSGSHLAGHHHPSVNPDSDRQPNATLAFEAVVAPLDRFDDSQTTARRALRVVLVRDRIPEVHEQAVADIAQCARHIRR